MHAAFKAKYIQAIMHGDVDYHACMHDPCIIHRIDIMHVYIHEWKMILRIGSSVPDLYSQE